MSFACYSSFLSDKRRPLAWVYICELGLDDSIIASFTNLPYRINVTTTNSNAAGGPIGGRVSDSSRIFLKHVASSFCLVSKRFEGRECLNDLSTCVLTSTLNVCITPHIRLMKMTSRASDCRG